MKDQNVTKQKSRDFALRVIELYQYLQQEKREFVLSKQLLRSGTSIGANIVEGHNSISKREFLAKMNIALKETAESEYWIELLFYGGYLNESEFASIQQPCSELKALLTAICKTTSQNLAHPSP